MEKMTERSEGTMGEKSAEVINEGKKEIENSEEVS